MSHTVKTTIITAATGEITGYGFCVEAQHNDEPMEIAACITYSLDILRQTISAAFAEQPEMAQPVTDQAREAVAEAQHPAPSFQPPATPAEAEQRFYARYAEAVGGSSWADVRRYLNRPRAPEPTSVAGWIATAEAVRDRSRTQTTTASSQRKYARH